MSITKTYGYNGDTDEFTVYDRTYNCKALCTVRVSITDSHKLQKAIDKLIKDAAESGISRACAAIESTIEELHR